MIYVCVNNMTWKLILQIMKWFSYRDDFKLDMWQMILLNVKLHTKEPIFYSHRKNYLPKKLTISNKSFSFRKQDIINILICCSIDYNLCVHADKFMLEISVNHWSIWSFIGPIIWQKCTPLSVVMTDWYFFCSDTRSALLDHIFLSILTKWKKNLA